MPALVKVRVEVWREKCLKDGIVKREELKSSENSQPISIGEKKMRSYSGDNMKGMAKFEKMSKPSK